MIYFGRTHLAKDHCFALAVCLVAILSVLLRTKELGKHSLWLDEIFGATFSTLGPKDIIVSVLRFDLHPPLYYLQLAAWARIVGFSDTDLALNSVAWDLATILALTVGLRRIIGHVSALCAGFTYSVLPPAIAYSHELRMYTMLPCLALLAWITAERLATGLRRTDATYFVLANTCLAASHATGGIIAAAATVAAIVRSGSLSQRPSGRTRLLLPIAIVWLVAGVCLANSAVRSVSHVPDFGIETILRTALLLVGGPSTANTQGLTAFSAALIVGLILFGMSRRGALCVMTLSMLILPLIAFGVASLLLRPVWLERTFLYAGPFIAILAATSAVSFTMTFSRHTPLSLATALHAPGIIYIIAAPIFLQWLDIAGLKATDYRNAGQFLKTHVQSGDRVKIPSPFHYWGVMRYVKGERWGSPLAIQDDKIPSYQHRWTHVLHAIGPTWINWLGLRSAQRYVEVDGTTYFIGETEVPMNGEIKSLWIVESNEHAEPRPPSGWHATNRIEFRGLIVYRLDPLANK